MVDLMVPRDGVELPTPAFPAPPCGPRRPTDDPSATDRLGGAGQYQLTRVLIGFDGAHFTHTNPR